MGKWSYHRGGMVRLMIMWVQPLDGVLSFSQSRRDCEVARRQGVLLCGIWTLIVNGCALMATSSSFLSGRPVDDDECQAHRHEDEAHGCETGSCDLWSRLHWFLFSGNNADVE